MIPLWKIYLKLACTFKSLLIIPLDMNYRVVPLATVKLLFDQMDSYKYKPDVFDCDDFSFIFKALASKNEINSVGLIVGKYNGGWHVWNFAYCDEGIYQIESQNKKVFKEDAKYKPVIIIL